jgi:hypothetical protein
LKASKNLCRRQVIEQKIWYKKDLQIYFHLFFSISFFVNLRPTQILDHLSLLSVCHRRHALLDILKLCRWLKIPFQFPQKPATLCQASPQPFFPLLVDTLKQQLNMMTADRVHYIFWPGLSAKMVTYNLVLPTDVANSRCQQMLPAAIANKYCQQVLQTCVTNICCQHLLPIGVANRRCYQVLPIDVVNRYCLQRLPTSTVKYH